MNWGVKSIPGKIFLSILFFTTALHAAEVSYINEYDADIVFNGSSLGTATSIISIEGTFFVPLQDIAQKLGLETNYINRKMVFEVYRQADRKQVSFKLNSDRIIINNDEEELMNYPVYHIKNRAYVSLADFVWTFGYFLEKRGKQQYHIVSRIDDIKWQDQKLIVSSRTPLNAELEYFNNSYLITIPNSIWSQPQQMPEINVNDGVINSIEIKNSQENVSNVVITVKTREKIPYIVFPEEKAVIISFIYKVPESKTNQIKEADNIIITKADTPKDKNQQPSKELKTKELVSRSDQPNFFTFTENCLLRQGESFLIKLPLKPDNILTLEDPKRLVLDFENTRITEAVSISGKPYLPLIKNIRAAQLESNPDIVRIVIETDNYLRGFNQFGKNLKLYSSIQAKAGPQKTAQSRAGEIQTARTTDVTSARIENIKEISGSSPKTIIQATTTAKEDNTAVRNTEITQLATTATPAEKKTEISYSPGKRHQFQKVLNGKRVVIDPGHGGRDPGAISRSGLLEKDPVLEVSRLIAEKVKAAGGVPIMLREADEFVSLEDRADMVLRKKGDLLISIHFNSFHKQNISGAESYYYKPKDYALAKAVHNQITRIKAIKNNGIKQAQMYILNHTHIPGVLIEPAYISNLKEEKLIQNQDFQQELSDAVVIGIINYLQNS